MTDDLEVLSRLVDYHDHISSPVVPVADDVRRGRRRVRRNRGVMTGAVAVAVTGVVLTASLITGGDRDAGPAPAVPSPSETRSTIEPDLQTGPSEVLAAAMAGRSQYRLKVAGEIVPGRWWLEESRGPVWVAGHSDRVGYMSTALWWGRGLTTHEVPGQRGGVAISQDARWIAWTRAASGGYGDLSRPWVMEVVDTATGKVRWSRNADADAPEIGPLAVTNDGVVVFGHCVEPVVDIGGTPQCDDARIDVWAARSGRTARVPAAVRVEDSGPPGTVAALTPLVQVTGAHNGLLVRDTRSGRPQYVHVSGRGRVEVLATLPRNTMAVTADERFALLATACAHGSMVCGWSVLPIDGGPQRPLPSLGEIVALATGYDWPVDPIVVERDDLIVVRDLGHANSYPAVARCSLAQARCVRIQD